VDSSSDGKMEHKRLGVGGLLNVSGVSSVGLGARMKATGFWQGQRQQGGRQWYCSQYKLGLDG